MEQIKTQLSPYPPYYGPYPQSPNSFRGYKPSFPNTHSYPPPCVLNLPSKQEFKLGFWELLSPALFGAAGALFLSLFSSEKNKLIKRFGGTLFKLAIVGYSIGTSVAVSIAISKTLIDSRPPYDHLILPIWEALVSIILFFGSVYLLLYRFFPSSFKGDVGDNFFTQLFSFLYLSTTTIATAGLGDIMPDGVTARALIAIEISFYLFTMATAVQLLLVQKN